MIYICLKPGLTWAAGTSLLITGGRDIKATKVIISLTSSGESTAGHFTSSLPGYYKAGKCCINQGVPLLSNAIIYRVLIRRNGTGAPLSNGVITSFHGVKCTETERVLR